MEYIECSAKEGDHIKDVFSQVAKTLMKRNELKNLPTNQVKKGKGLT